ncbi:MAG: DUF819 family protein, partial [Cyclobacteriaceae bacterium]|nr:DUF819 family protein [Cyclobacteriaceae bacterium]
MNSQDIIALVLVLVTVFIVLKINSVNNRIVQGILNWFPAILLAYVIPAAFTHLFQWDLSQVQLHNWSRNAIIPMTLLAVMSSLPIKQLAIVGWRPLILFLAGSLVIATLPVVLVLVFSSISIQSEVLFIEESYWKGLVPIVGGWIGGSTSQLILKELAETPENLFLSVLVLDNILVNIWTILMFQFIKKGEKLSLLLGIQDRIPENLSSDSGYQKGIKVRPVFVILIFAGLALLTFYVQLSFLNTVIVLSLVGLALGNILPIWNTSFSLKLGG